MVPEISRAPPRKELEMPGGGGGGSAAPENTGGGGGGSEAQEIPEGSGVGQLNHCPWG